MIIENTLEIIQFTRNSKIRTNINGIVKIVGLNFKTKNLNLEGLENNRLHSDAKKKNRRKAHSS